MPPRPTFWHTWFPNTAIGAAVFLLGINYAKLQKVDAIDEMKKEIDTIEIRLTHIEDQINNMHSECPDNQPKEYSNVPKSTS